MQTGHSTREQAARFGDDVACAAPIAGGLPLFIEPTRAALRSDGAQAAAWFRDHRPAFEAAVLEHGAVVLRGFAIQSTEDFAQLVAHFTPHAMGYAGGATARQTIKGNVYEASRIPPEVTIMLHQEMAYLPNYPRLLAFFCRSPARQGGATTIGDMRRFTAMVPEHVLSKVKKMGVRYLRNFRSPDTRDERSDPIYNHRTWQEAFFTSDPREVEQNCRERKLDFEWLPDGSLTTSNRLPGWVRHPQTGDVVWFNHIASQIIHRRWMGDKFNDFHRIYGDDLPRATDTRYGDGARVADADFTRIHDLLEEVTVEFPWQGGDVMFVDNILTAHGRMPFAGERDVQVALLD